MASHHAVMGTITVAGSASTCAHVDVDCKTDTAWKQLSGAKNVSVN